MSEENRLQYFSKDLQYQYLLDETFPSLSLRDSKVSGKGIHTDVAIKKGDIVCPLFGILYNMEKAKIDYPRYSYQISDVIAVETANEPGFFNHSCEPNVFINADWMFEAMRDIDADEEIVIDYAMFDYFDYEFDCTCGAQQCRKKFSGTFSADPEYQKKKSQYFSPYLKNKFHLIAPEVMRQRLLVDFTTELDLTKEIVENFLKELVAELQLTSYGGPMVYETGGTGKPINQGYDGFIALVDSGISISTWRDSGLVSLYVHTCKAFSEEQTINFVKKYFNPKEIQFKEV